MWRREILNKQYSKKVDKLAFIPDPISDKTIFRGVGVHIMVGSQSVQRRRVESKKKAPALARRQ